MSENVCVYARYSSDRQRAESIEDQLRVCGDYCKSQGYEVVDTYTDAAMSGTNDRRPGFQRMIDDAKQGRWSAVVVYKLDRFARDRYASAVYKHRLKKHGVRVVSATEPIPDTPEGVLMESMLEGWGEYYSKQLGQNVRRGMEGNARKCLVNGCHLYGYRTAADGRYEVYEPEARLIREAFSMRADGYKIGTIANELCVRMGKTYKQAYNLCVGMFDNPKYAGVYSWGGVVIPGGMPAIVDAALFDRVNSMRGNVRMKSKRAEYPLAGRIFDQDGVQWHGESAKSGKYYYYSNGKVRIRRETLEAAVWDTARAAMSEDARGRLIDGVVRLAHEHEKTPVRTRAEVEADIKACIDMVKKIGATDDLALELQRLEAEKSEIEERKIADKMARGVTRAAVEAWFDRFMSARSDKGLEALVQRVELVHDGARVLSATAYFTWAQKSELPAAGEFALGEDGTPYQNYSNLRLYSWGLSVTARIGS